MTDDELKPDRRAAYEANTETFELAKRRDIPALIERLQSPLETEDFSVRFAAMTHLGKRRDGHSGDRGVCAAREALASTSRDSRGAGSVAQRLLKK